MTHFDMRQTQVFGCRSRAQLICVFQEQDLLHRKATPLSAAVTPRKIFRAIVRDHAIALVRERYADFGPRLFDQLNQMRSTVAERQSSPKKPISTKAESPAWRSDAFCESSMK
jgi:hypothetical protein